MNHHWFINFTSRQGDQKKKYKSGTGEPNDVMSLRTIIECSEPSELDNKSGIFIITKKKKNKHDH